MSLKNISFKTTRRLLLAFEIMALILMFFYSQGEVMEDKTIIIVLGLVILIYASNYILNKITTGDRFIFLIVSMLLTIGGMMIYRVDPILGAKQLLWMIIGVIAFFATYIIMKKISGWEKWIKFYIGGSYLLFFLTLTLGTSTKGAKNWIDFKIVKFQPAELIKVLMIFILASYYGKVSENRELGFKEKNNSLVLTSVIYSFLALLFYQRDLGMALVFYGIFVCIQFIYEEDRKILLYNILLFVFGGSIGYLLFDHVKVRFKTWINPWEYIDNMGYQITQSLFAIAEGGFFGTGIGKGYPGFIPEVHTDFIFGAICEEMGTFMGIGVIMLFLIFIYRGFKIGITQRNKFYRILAIGISISFGIQIFIILGGVLKIIPLTGITLPFISYGGSSMLTSFIALGVLQRASEEIEDGDMYE